LLKEIIMSEEPVQGQSLKTITIEKIAEKYGLFTFIALAVFFIVMRVVGLAHIVELRMLNFFILAYGVYLGINAFKRKSPDSFTYLKGLGTGFLTSAIACLLFGLFMFIYIQFIDPAFMDSIRENEAMGRYLNPYIASVAVAVEGIATGMILSFIIVNYAKPKKAV